MTPVVVLAVAVPVVVPDPADEPAVVEEVDDGVDVVPVLGECCCDDDVDGSGDVAAPAMTISGWMITGCCCCCCCFDVVAEEDEGNC